jgi:hypothetical protein
MTRDTVAGESARCSAKNFKLTDRAEVFPRGGEDATVFARIMGCFVAVVWHNGVAPASGNTKFFANVAARPVKSKTDKHKKNRFIMNGPSTMYSGFSLHST